MIKRCKGLSYEERLRKLGIPTLEHRRHRADLIQVYRLFSGIDRMDANVFFSLHNEYEAGSVRAESRGHPRKLSKSSNGGLKIKSWSDFHIFCEFNIMLEIAES